MSIKCCLALSAIAIATAGSAGAGSFTFVTVDPPASATTRMTGINDAGTVVGYYFNAGKHGRAHAFIEKDGNFTTAKYPGAYDDSFLSINKTGTALASLYMGGGVYQAATYKARVFTTFAQSQLFPLQINDGGTVAGYDQAGGHSFGFVGDATHSNVVAVSGATDTLLAGINRAGSFVGYYINADQSVHGLTGSLSGLISFDYPGATLTYGAAISDADVFGTYVDTAGTQHGMRLRDGVYQDLTPPGASFTNLVAANKGGTAVGSYTDGTGQHGLVVNPDGTMFAVDVPGGADTLVTGVNNVGQIVGTYDANFMTHGFVGTCVKTMETSTCAP